MSLMAFQQEMYGTMLILVPGQQAGASHLGKRQQRDNGSKGGGGRLPDCGNRVAHAAHDRNHKQQQVWDHSGAQAFD